MARAARSFLRVVFCVGVLCGCTVAISRPSAITLENNEYRQILVAIDDNVNDDPSLVQTIQDTFTKASAFLYTSTNHRAVFRDVTILVPARWSNPSNAYGTATTEVYSNADVIFSAPITSAPPPDDVRHNVGVNKRSVQLQSFSGDWSPNDRPPAQTKVYAGCGHQGVRVTMTTDILTNRRLQSTVGPPEKALVHEWAHFRWGVFDEYGLPGEPQFYFSPKTGNLSGVRCTELIQGIIRLSSPAPGQNPYCREVDPATGLYPEGCVFLPYPAGPQVTGVQASVMDHVYIRPMAKFCDDQKDNPSTVHNYDAPSRHNRLCGHRSTWDVIASSDDFSNNANPSRDGVSTTPTFRVVQAHATRRMMLALDTSASMADDSKLTRMKQAVATFIQEGVAPATEVGLTTFSDDTQVQRAPQLLKTTQDRQAFADDLPDTQGGATDITLALTTAAKHLQNLIPQTTATSAQRLARHAREVLVQPSSGAVGGHVVLVTDGRGTSGGDVTSALPLLRQAAVMVSFVILGGQPQPELELLAQSTGGRIYYDSNSHSSTAATGAFFDLLDNMDCTSPNSPIQVVSRAEALLPGQSLAGTVSLDPHLGNTTTFLVAYDVSLPTVRVTSPSGRVYSPLYPEYSVDRRLKMVKILIPGRAESGRWTYKVGNAGGYQRVSLLVLSAAVDTALQPVVVSGTLIGKTHSSPATIHIFADVSRGSSPVTGMKVTALVSKPDGSSEKVELMDNGAGADIVENDGVYSRFFSQLRDPGVYTVRLDVTGHVNHGHVNHGHTDTGPMDPENQLVQRTVSAGHFVVTLTNNTTGAHASSGSGNDDIEAPVRISDLRVVKTSNRNQTVVLSWRASGDDTDRDTAAHYEVFMAPSAEDLLTGTSYVTNITQADILHGNLRDPKPFGGREFYMLRIPDSLPFRGRDRFVFTVVAVDEVGNRGRHSNYVTVGLGGVPDVTDHRYWRDDQFQQATTQLDAPEDQRQLIAGILGTVSGLLVLVILVTVVVAFFTSGKRKDSKISLPMHSVRTTGPRDKKNVFAMS